MGRAATEGPAVTIRWVRLAGPLLVGTLALAACDGGGQGDGGTTDRPDRSGDAAGGGGLGVRVSSPPSSPPRRTRSRPSRSRTSVRSRHDLVIDEANLKIVAPTSETARGGSRSAPGPTPSTARCPVTAPPAMEGTLTVRSRSTRLAPARPRCVVAASAQVRRSLDPEDLAIRRVRGRMTHRGRAETAGPSPRMSYDEHIAKRSTVWTRRPPLGARRGEEGSCEGWS